MNVSSANPSAGRRRWLLLLAALLLVPHLFASPLEPGKLKLGAPRVYSGDEPHYLLLVNSLLHDGDVDQANNYAAVHRGAGQAGKLFAGGPLDHHSSWYAGDRLLRWHEVFELDPRRWDRDAQGFPRPRVRPGISAQWLPQREYSIRPVGLPVLVAAVLWPLRGTDWLEPACVLLSGLAMVAALLLFHALLGDYPVGPKTRWAVTAVAFLGTPAWHYGRTFFPEPFLTALALGAYGLILRRDRAGHALLAGLLLGAAVAIKPPMAVLAVPPALDALWRRGLGRAVWFSLPVAAGVASVLAMNAYMHGSPFRQPQAWESSAGLEGFLGLWFSWNHGLLAFVPILPLALACWPAFWQSRRRDALLLGGGFVLYYLLIALYGGWDGGFCYGPRHLVPVMPWLLVPLCLLGQQAQHGLVRGAAFFLGGLGILINLVGAIPYWSSWMTHPLLVLLEQGLKRLAA